MFSATKTLGADCLKEVDGHDSLVRVVFPALLGLRILRHPSRKLFARAAVNGMSDVFFPVEHSPHCGIHPSLATMTDLNLDPMIREALSSNLFDGGEAKFLRMFQPGGKAIFDNVVHKPGANALVDKEYLTTVVEPLNKLLGAIAQ